MKILWMPTAIARLSDINDYISRDSVAHADKWIAKILEAVTRLEDFPESGRIVPEINNLQFREIIFGKYRIFYEIKADHIAILTIRHCKRLFDTDEIIKKDV